MAFYLESKCNTILLRSNSLGLISIPQIVSRITLARTDVSTVCIRAVRPYTLLHISTLSLLVMQFSGLRFDEHLLLSK